MGECVLRLAVEGFALLVLPLVHGEGLSLRGRGNGTGGVELRLKGCFPNGGH